MAGPLLRSGSLREFKALGVVGTPVFSAATPLRATIRRRLGVEAAELLAVPQINEAGDTVDWYAPVDGPVVPWSAATEDERHAAWQFLEDKRRLFESRGKELVDGLDGPRRDSSSEVVGRMLPLALRIPDETHLYLVGGRPVVTFWGFDLLNAAEGCHVIRDMRFDGVAKAAAVPPPPVVAVPWWRRWLWLFILLPLLALLALLGLHGCGVPIPGVGMAIPPVPGVDTPKEPAPGIDLPPGQVVVPVVPGGVAVAGVGGDGSATPPNAVEMPVAPARPDQSKDRNKDSRKDSPPVPPQPGQPPKPGGADQSTAPPLTIPDAAAKSGGVGFLDGHWHSRTGLVDSETGRPLDVEYDFKDGKGTATIHRSDGSACSAAATAAMHAGKLVIDQTGDAVCPDGQRFDRSKVECKAGKDGRADCSGVNANGKDAYRVEIVK